MINKLPKAREREWSYLETIGVAHRETIMANLLAFYFDPGERHGLGDVFIRALLQTRPKHLCENKNVEGFRDRVESIAMNGFGRANVIVEDSTDDNKRLDILIETDKLVIAIEFKINHELNNPLISYVNRVRSQYPQEKYYVVLTPQWKKLVGPALEGETYFKQIILSHFIKNVESLVKEEGKFIGDEGTRQLMHFNDFLNTIENRKIRINMINGYFDIVKRDALSLEQIENAFKQLNELKDHLEKEMDELLKLLNGKFGGRFSVLSSSKTKIESVVCCTKGDKQIKIRLNLHGWAIERWKKELGKSVHIESERKTFDIEVSKEVLMKEADSVLSYLNS